MRSRKSMTRPSPGRSRRRFLASPERMESRHLLAVFTVTTTADSGPGSLRQAITQSNLPHAGADTINFAIPASTSPGLDVPAPGFDPTTQTWRITPATALPTITHQVTIDGDTQAQFPVLYRYPAQSASQLLTLTGNPTGGAFTLTTSAPLPIGTTPPIPFNANRDQVRAALETIVGAGNVVVTGASPLPGGTLSIVIVGPFDGVAVPPLTPLGLLTGGTLPLASIGQGIASAPVAIISKPNGTPIIAATDGNNAIPRLIVDGAATGGATGFVIDAPHSILRGLVIDGFGVGVFVPNPGDVGVLIQGDDIGKFPLFFVDPSTGATPTGTISSRFDPATGVPLTAISGSTAIAGRGNALQGVLLGSTNTTVGGVGGSEIQDSNVIIGNGQQGVSILPGAQGNQVIGDQIGIIGPPTPNGTYFIVPNGAEGVLIASPNNSVGGAAAGAGNLISGNLGDGVRIVGPAASRNNVRGNYIGIGPGGEILFGSGGTGNLGDGVAIDNAGDNLVGGTTAADRNVISSNEGAGVRIFGAPAVRNLVQGNFIGLTTDGISPVGDHQEGVAIFSSDNVVGPGNVISANLRGVLLAGAGATRNLVVDNRIGTDLSGTADIGNAQEGVRIDQAAGNSISGNAGGSQVISGNNVGLLIFGPSATLNQVQGNFIGTDATGKLDLGNSQEGVRIEDGPRNLIGDPTGTARNLISANHGGVTITGPQAVFNVVQGNFIGTDAIGTSPLGNELDGVLINRGASGNLIGGPTVPSGNSISFNRRDGVRVEDASVSNAILTNSIFANGGLGIDLLGQQGLIVRAPKLTGFATSINSTIISGTLASIPNGNFTIQFFANPTPGPFGVIQGRQFLGQATATTGADGMATYSANVPSSILPGQLVTATATDAFGDTSEFSATAPPEVFGTVQFRMVGYVVGDAAGSATIVATRSGGSGGQFTVAYATADGSPGASSEYVPTSGTLTFAPGVNTQSFTVPIINTGQPSGDVSVLLALANPTGPITLGTSTSAVLTILGNQPGAFRFTEGLVAVNEAAGSATIAVTRDQGGLASTVNYAVGGGTAIAGVDYVPTSGTLSFAPGELTKTFTVPILIDPQIMGNPTVILTLSSPTGQATLGAPSSAVLVIVNDGVNRRGPRVNSVKAVSGPFGVAELVVAYDEPLDPARAVDLLNYGYSVRTAGRDGKLGTADDKLVGLCPATYDPATFTVTLPLAVAVPAGTKLELMINQATDVPGQGVGVSDLLGNLLDGNGDGHPGGPFQVVVVARPSSSPHQAASKVTHHAKHPAPVSKARPHPVARPAKPSAHHR